MWAWWEWIRTIWFKWKGVIKTQFYVTLVADCTISSFYLLLPFRRLALFLWSPDTRHDTDTAIRENFQNSRYDTTFHQGLLISSCRLPSPSKFWPPSPPSHLLLLPLILWIYLFSHLQKTQSDCGVPTTKKLSFFNSSEVVTSHFNY
jgi:hypothetical protein